MTGKTCEYPERDRVVTVHESDILKLQRRIHQLEQVRSGSTPPEDILDENVFQTEGTTDSSLYSFLDIDVDQTSAMKFYYKEVETPNIPLPGKDYALFLMGKVMLFLGQEYYLFDQSETLNKQVDRIYDTGEDLCFLFVTLAIGQQYMNVKTGEDVPGICFFNMALRHFQPNHEEPTTKFIQTLLLMAFYLQGLNRSNTSYAYYGLAVRACLVLGLHRRATYLSIEEQERRRRLWWTCHCMDVIWSAKLGLPIHVETADVTAPLKPLADLNDGFKTEILELTGQLSDIIVYVMKTIYKPTTKKTISQLLICMTKLSNFQQGLPDEMKFSIIIPNDRTNANLYLRLNQIMIITVRPLLLSTFMGQHNGTGYQQAIKKCVSAAASNINILHQLREIGMFSEFGFWDARYLFSSLLVLYMTSGHDSLIALGRDLNKAMCDSGNFTALENEIRLKELDALFDKIKDTSVKSATATPLPNLALQTTETSPNTVLLDSITNTFSLSPLEQKTDGFLDLFQPLSKELPEDVWKSITNNLKTWDSVG